MKSHFTFFGFFLHSFLIFAMFHVASASWFAAAKPISSPGCAADPKGAAAFERGSGAQAHE